jgi:hypothetical protein
MALTGERTMGKRMGAARPVLLGALTSVIVAACSSSADPLSTVPPEGVSAEMSVVTVSAPSVQVGATATAILQVRDAQGNDLATSGLTVVFTATGGSSQGSFSPTVDQGNGRYHATFTGTTAGTPTTIGATINGVAVTSQLPSVEVTTSPTTPGSPVCEATGSARCWYVAANAPAGGNGTFQSPLRVPQDAIGEAGPGDVIYLRGGAEFTMANAYVDPVHGSYLAFILGRHANDGEPARPITLKSYPGEQAVVRGTFAPGEHIGINVSKSHWRVEGLRVFHGSLSVGSSGSGLGIRDVRIVGNHLSDVIATPGNFGIITVTGQHTQGDPIDHSLDPIDIFIHGNRAHTLWGQQPDGSVVPWHQDVYIEHHACFMLQKSGGLVELVDNEFSECANIFYSKWEGPGPTIARDNYFHSARNIVYRWRSDRPEFHNNVFARFQREGASFDITQGDVVGAVFRGNTFDFGPWSMNPQGSRGAVRWNAGQHVFRDNVVFAAQYHGGNPASGSDIDGNCVVWDASLVAVPGYSWSQYRATFGHDVNGVHVSETEPSAVFADRMAGNFALIGEVAERCEHAGV